jgi:pimeloyl-ACP methyl ester carboxylesterase
MYHPRKPWRIPSAAITSFLCTLFLAGSVLPTPTAAQSRKVLPPGELGEVHKSGEGEEVLLLIPCMSCRWRSFDTFMERNHERYTMVAVTLPGFGGTPPPDLPYNSAATLWQDNAVEALSRWLDKQKLKSVVVVGHSFGTDIGLQLTARRPDVVKALVLLDGWPFSDRSWFPEEQQDRLKEAIRIVADQSAQFSDLDEWQKFNTPRSITDPDRRLLYHGWFMSTPVDSLLQYWRENTLRDLNPLWSRVQVPVLDVKSISSRSNPEKAKARRREQLSNNGVPNSVKTVFLHRTGHFVIEERPKVLDQLLVDFLGGKEVSDFVPPTE